MIYFAEKLVKDVIGTSVSRSENADVLPAFLSIHHDRNISFYANSENIKMDGWGFGYFVFNLQ